MIRIRASVYLFFVFQFVQARDCSEPSADACIALDDRNNIMKVSEY